MILAGLSIRLQSMGLPLRLSRLYNEQNIKHRDAGGSGC
jgi:hypothetical protein